MYVVLAASALKFFFFYLFLTLIYFQQFLLLNALAYSNDLSMIIFKIFQNIKFDEIIVISNNEPKIRFNDLNMNQKINEIITKIEEEENNKNNCCIQ